MMNLDDLVLDLGVGLLLVDSSKPSIICGDFNCRMDKGNRGTTLNRTLEGYGFFLANDPNIKTYITQKGSSTIDLIFHNLGPRLSNPVEIVPILTKRHQQIVLQVPKIKIQEKSPNLKRCLDADILGSHPLIPDIFYGITDGQLDRAVNCFTIAMVSAIPTFNPSRNHHKPWFDEECLTLKQALLQLRKSGGQQCWTLKKKSRLLPNKRDRIMMNSN